MSPIVRIWLGFAAFGAGIVHLALVTGSSPVLAVPSAVIGVAETAWGVACFAVTRVPFTRTAVIAGIAVPAASLALLAFGVGIPALPVVVTTVLELGAATGLALSARRAASAPARPATAGATVALLFAGALLTGCLVTPAIAATAAGELAAPHGGHGPGHPGP